MLSENSCVVSVCIPTYLGAANLSTTIDSVLGQSFDDFELIIIDDNSPDETAALVSGYTDLRIRYFRNSSNLGPEGNWNRCLQEARGHYFKLLPQDDLLYPDILKRQVDILEQDKNARIALVFGARDIINSDNQIITRRSYPGGREGIIPGLELIRRCVRFGTNLIGEPGGILVRRSLTDTIGRFDGSIPYVIDLDYWVRLLSHGNGYYMADPVSAFRVYPGSWSVAIGTHQGEEYRRFIAKLSSQHDLKYLNILIGNQNARLNNFLRLLFYRFILSKRAGF